MKSSPICPYCGEQALLVTGQDIFSHRPDLYAKSFWECIPCGAYVGCHPNGTTPLGILANEQTRKARSAAHAAFDKLWKECYIKTRSGAYAWLAKRLGIPQAQCHIALFDVATCNRVIDICSTFPFGTGRGGL